MPKVLLEEAPIDEVVAGPPPSSTAPMPPVLPAAARNGPRMEQVLEAAGAVFDPEDGTWYREVPDPRIEKQLVLRGSKAFYATAYMRRIVATGSSWREAVAAAQADTSGMTDAYIPGRGWARAGRKLETERPENVGDLSRMGAVTSIRYEEAPVDAAEAIKANAIVQAAAAAQGERIAAAPVED